MENKEIKKKRFWSKKYFLFGILPLFVISLVLAASYVVSTLTLTVGVAEPFTVEYAFLGDAGNYVSGDCKDATNWIPTQTQSIPTGDMYAGESRYVCVNITNKAEASIPYTIGSNFNNETCALAFGNPINITGKSVGAKTFVIDGTLVKADVGATPISGCNVVISVSRG